jgi:hypothetical protein
VKARTAITVASVPVAALIVFAAVVVRRQHEEAYQAMRLQRQLTDELQRKLDEALATHRPDASVDLRRDPRGDFYPYYGGQPPPRPDKPNLGPTPTVSGVPGRTGP